MLGSSILEAQELATESKRFDDPAPQPDLWSDIKKALQQDGQRYFESAMQDALIPGGITGVYGLSGVVRATEPGKLLLSMPGATQPEITLNLIGSGMGSEHITPGMPVVFAGVVKAFTKDPFMLTLEAEAGDGSGDTFVFPDFQQRPTVTSILVVTPTREHRPNNVGLLGLPIHAINFNGRSAFGVRLARLLIAAGEGEESKKVSSLRVEGIQSVAVMPEDWNVSGKNEAWLVVSPEGNLSADYVLLLPDGTVIQEVNAVQRIVIGDKH